MEATVDRAFFERSPAELAPALLGWRLRAGEVELAIAETESYMGSTDPASHAFSGPTPRTAPMFGPSGHCYIYRSYGIHLCFNVVGHEPGQAGAVLVRAGTVTAGRAIAALRRGRETDLANGPGRLGQALGLDIALSGSCLLHGPLRLIPPSRPLPASEILVGPRIGISRAVDMPLRFWVASSPDVSRHRRTS